MTEIQNDIVADVLFERKKQEEQWGKQNHSQLKWLAILIEEVGEIGECVNEIFPAIKAEMPRLSQYKALRKEIIQTAAVCIAWLECIERKGYE